MHRCACGVRAGALRRLGAQGITSGPLFRSLGKDTARRLGATAPTTRRIDLILKRAAARAGVPVAGPASWALGL